MFFNWFGWVQPLTDIVVVCVLKTEVILLYDIHLIVDLFQQLLSSGLLLNIKFVISWAKVVYFYRIFQRNCIVG